MAANLAYRLYSQSNWYTSDAYDLSDLFEAWIAAINANNSQQNRQVQHIYGPTTGSSQGRGNLAKFPTAAGVDTYVNWVGTSTSMNLKCSSDWLFTNSNFGYGTAPGTAAAQAGINMAFSPASAGRGYLVASETRDNREFFGFGWYTLSAENAILIFKDRAQQWCVMGFDSFTQLGFFVNLDSAANYNVATGPQLHVGSSTVASSLTIPYSSPGAIGYQEGTFFAQPASSDIYAINSVKGFGLYYDLGDSQYLTSLGSQAFWVRHGVNQQEIIPDFTFTVTVVDDEYVLDGVENQLVTTDPQFYLEPGKTYAFDQSDPSNLGYEIVAYDDSYATLPIVTQGSEKIFTVPLTYAPTGGTRVVYFKADAMQYFTAGLGMTVEDTSLAPTRPDGGFTITGDLLRKVLTVADDGGGNKFYLDAVKQDTWSIENFRSAVDFIQDDPSNVGHPVELWTGPGKTGTQLTPVLQYGTIGDGGLAGTIFDVSSYDDSTLYYECGNHSGMGGELIIGTP